MTVAWVAVVKWALIGVVVAGFALAGLALAIAIFDWDPLLWPPADTGPL